MNLAQVARLLSGFALFFTLSQLLPLGLTFFEPSEEFRTRIGFTGSLTIGLTVSLVLRMVGRRAGRDFYRREGLATVGFAWVLAGAMGALPFYWSGALYGASDAWFESVSGLTTTGASVFGSGGHPAVESLPPSLLLWRSQLQWMGGLGILLVFIVLLPFMGLPGKPVLDSEQVGVTNESVRPSMKLHGRYLFRLYVVLTALAVLGYRLAGMPLFDALCHAFTTLATGGFSTRNASIGSYESIGVELVAILFMFLAGCNFALLIGSLRRGRHLTLLRNPEFRLYLGLTIGVTLAMTLILRLWGHDMADPLLGASHDYGDIGRCLRDGAFQAVSILTSTGYCTADFQNWPRPALYLLTLCMLIGSCTGSTAGGFKVLRLLVCHKLIVHSIRHFINPRRIEKIRVGGEVVADRIVSSILALLVLWMSCVAIGTLILSLDPNLELVSAFTASASMMGCTGPAISEVSRVALDDGAGRVFLLVNESGINLGPYGGYGGLPAWIKAVLPLLMILGRLEILAPLALLVPSFWRR